MQKKSVHKEQQERASWSSRSIGRDWQHRFFYWVIRFGGRRLAYFVLYFVVAYYVLFSRLVRDRAGHYLRRRFPEASEIGRVWHCYRQVLSFGQVLIDRAAVGILGPDTFAVHLSERDELLKLRDENQGMILMAAHVGCWQVAMSALDFLDRPVHMLMRQEEGDIDRHYFEHAGMEAPYRTIDPAGYLGGTLEMMGALKQGHIVSVMGDRLLGSDRSAVKVRFLGDDIYLPFSAYKIASATGAPVVVFFTAKVGHNSYQLKLARIIRVPSLPGRDAETFHPYAVAFGTSLEDYCRDNPYQFYNFFDLWSESERPQKHDHKE